jgi:hypothetical protein
MWKFIRALFPTPQGRSYPTWGQGLISFHGPVPAEPEIVSEPPTEFAEATAPDWLLRWEGCALPHGGSLRGRLGIWESEMRGEGFVECPISRSRPVAPKEFVADQEFLYRVLDRLRDSFPSRFVNVQSQSIDGMPFELFVYRRVPFYAIRACCNLCDAMPGRSPAGESSLPVFELGWELWSLTRRVAPPNEQRADS